MRNDNTHALEDGDKNDSVMIPVCHYTNMPRQSTAIFHGCINTNFQMKIVIFFLFLLKT